jgi:hypothetical protein
MSINKTTAQPYLHIRNKDSASSFVSEGETFFLLWRNHLIVIMMLFWALPPPLRYPPITIVPYTCTQSWRNFQFR